MSSERKTIIYAKFIFLLFSIFLSHSFDMVSFLTLFFLSRAPRQSLSFLYSSLTTSFLTRPLLIISLPSLYLHRSLFLIRTPFSSYHVYTTSVFTWPLFSLSTTSIQHLYTHVLFFSQILFSLCFSHTTAIQHPTNHKTTSNNSGCRTINLS